MTRNEQIQQRERELIDHGVNPEAAHAVAVAEISQPELAN